MHIIQYNRWLECAGEYDDLKQELISIKDDTEAIRERFAIDLSFGTAGLRGILGVGTNRMNVYTVRKATQGLANYLKNSLTHTPSVAIAYDSRIKSDLFAQQAATVLVANGVTVHMYPTLQPVPLLSFAVRRLKCDAGIMITASHNPAKYNGFKAYGPDGCQMHTQSSGAVTAEIERIDIFDDVKNMTYDNALRTGILHHIGDDIIAAYQKSVIDGMIRKDALKDTQLKIVYSPLNGTGNIPVRRALADAGISNVWVVKEQEHPNGNFPTTPFPNPEYRETLDMGLDLAKEVGADLVLATDPDADRVGIAVLDSVGEYRLISGNEMGVLLLDYVCSGRIECGTMPKNPLTVRSIVSTCMADKVAKAYGVEMIEVLTGFKYIGEQILKLEESGEENRFVFGFEESYGYLAGSYVRDKDAVQTSLLICEAAAYYKQKGMSLYEAMDALYKKHGYYMCKVISFDFEGLSGMDKMASIMTSFRETPPKNIAGVPVEVISDYDKKTITYVAIDQVSELDLPQSNVITYTLQDGHLVTVRPSGTEPKVKIYYTVHGDSINSATAFYEKLHAAMSPLLSE